MAKTLKLHPGTSPIIARLRVQAIYSYDYGFRNTFASSGLCTVALSFSTRTYSAAYSYLETEIARTPGERGEGRY